MQTPESPDIHPRAPKPPHAAAKTAAKAQERPQGLERAVLARAAARLLPLLGRARLSARLVRGRRAPLAHRAALPGVRVEARGRLRAGRPSNGSTTSSTAAAGALLGDLRRMTHANMSEEIEFFVRALDADLIIPTDF